MKRETPNENWAFQKSDTEEVIDFLMLMLIFFVASIKWEGTEFIEA